MSRAKRNAAADDYLRRAPNYSAEAIAGLAEMLVLHGKRGDARDEETHLMVIDKLLSSHKFSLPDGGHMFTDTKSWMLNGTRPPFDVTAFEFSMRGVKQTGALTGDLAQKIERVVLLALREAPVTVLFPVIETASGWQMALWFPILHDDETVFYGPGEAPAGLKFYGPPESVHEGFVATGIKFHRLGETADRLISSLGLDEPDIQRRAMVGTFHFVAAYAQACAALACTNVTTETLRPNREARAARPASTLFDYHVLMIEPGREHATSEDRGGSHASPRTHLRRGHIRRLAWGPRVWVNSCVVNPTAIGSVNKDYRVRP